MVNKITRLLVTLGILFLTANWAMAGNNVELQTDVPNIPKSICDQAGNIVMLFESGASMQEGDTITFSLSNNVTVCKAIDFYLRLADDGSEQLQNDTSLPLYDTSGGNDVLFVTDENQSGMQYGSPMVDNGVTFDVGFRVSAPVGASEITVTLGRRITANPGTLLLGGFYTSIPAPTNGKFAVTYNPDENDNNMVVRLFDQKTNAGQGFFWYDNPIVTGGVDYTSEFTENDDHLNALCVNTSSALFTGEYVLATPSSTVSDDSFKLSFSGVYSIAHITTGSDYSVTLACKDDCPTFSIGVVTDQWGNETLPIGEFDPGNYDSSMSPANERWSSTGTCLPSDGNGLILKQSGSNFTNASKYSVSVQLYVNSTAANQTNLEWDSGLGSTGVYIGASSASGKCASVATPWTGGTTSGWTINTSDKTIITATITAGTAHDAFLIDLPPVDYLYTSLQVGDVINAKVTFGKYPCGTGAEATVCLGTVVAACPEISSYELYFPFATAKNDVNFWTGISIVNLSPKTATLTITLYDVNGGSGVLSNLSLAPYNSYVDNMAGIIGTAGFTPSVSPAFSEDVNLIVRIGSNKKVDGICFVGNMLGTQLHGYLPRVFTGGSVTH